MSYQQYDHSNPPYVDQSQPTGYPPSAFEIQRPVPVLSGHAYQPPPSPYQPPPPLLPPPTQYYTAPTIQPPPPSQYLNSYPPSSFHIEPPPLQHVSPAQTYIALPPPLDPVPPPKIVSPPEPPRAPEPEPAPVAAPAPKAAPAPDTNVDSTSELDYLLLLLSLAEKYFTAARAEGYNVACANNQSDLDRYHKLIATGLGCLDSLLKTWRLQPRTEALVRLRYASVLNEETENIAEAETTLDKGITLCERNRLVELKHSMQHLQARVMYRKNPRAAIKWLDGVIREIEAYQLIPWEYAFRFLSVSLSLQASSPSDTNSALQQLRKITALSSERGDHDIYGVASIIEAQVHLRSGRDDSIDQAQKALEAARSSQSANPSTEKTHFTAMISILDLSCSLMEADPKKSVEKLKELQPLMDEVSQSSTWPADGVFSVIIPSSSSSGKPPAKFGGIVRRNKRGQESIKFSWMPARDVYCLCFLLSGATMSHRNAQSGHKAESYLKEGLKLIGEMDKGSDQTPQSFSEAVKRLTWRRTLQCYLKLHWIFSHCARTDWKTARQAVKELQEDANNFNLQSTVPLNILIRYVTGLIHQGTGNLQAALNIFRSPELSLSAADDSKGSSLQTIRRDISILALLNTVFILHDPSHPLHGHVGNLIASLEPLCASHGNQNFRSALHLVKAACHPTDPMIKKKLAFQKALTAAQTACNTQLTCITLACMSWTFFRGVVGPQAEKSARASWTMAMRGQDELWIGVTTGMMADTLEVQGQMEEAKTLQADAYRMAEKVVPALQAGAQRGANS